jgi:3-dehydroquinate dehydratase I
MKKIKICTPVIGRTLKEFLKNLDKVQEISEMVELRVDNIKNISNKDLMLIRKKTVKESIFTCRDKDIILQAFKLGFDCIDVELSLFLSLDLSKRAKTKVILSFHNFNKTPDIQELTRVVNRMRECKVGIIKIATKINKDRDIKNLLQLLLTKKKEEKMIIVGMGKRGRIIRILSPLLGSFLTYASTNYGKSAQGQIDINKLKEFYKLLTFHF